MGAGWNSTVCARTATSFPWKSVSVRWRPRRTCGSIPILRSGSDGGQNSGLSKGTERRNAELIAVNKELESFKYSVSPRPPSPLRAIDGFSLALLKTARQLGPAGKEHLQRVRAATTRMGQLIDDMLGWHARRAVKWFTKGLT